MPGSDAATRADAPALLLLLGAWRSTSEWRKAEAACAALLEEGVRPAGLDRALLGLRCTHTERHSATRRAPPPPPTPPTTRHGRWRRRRRCRCAFRRLRRITARRASGGAVGPARRCRLSCCGRALSVLPDAIGELSALQVLDASDNAHVAAGGARSLRRAPRASPRCKRVHRPPGVARRLAAFARAQSSEEPPFTLPAVVLRCARLRYLRWGAQRAAADAAAVEAGEAAAVEAAGRGGRGFASPSLAVLELEANGQRALPRLHPRDLVLTAVLASFNDLRAVPSQLVAYGPTLKKLHLGSNQIASVDAAAIPGKGDRALSRRQSAHVAAGEYPMPQQAARALAPR